MGLSVVEDSEHDWGWLWWFLHWDCNFGLGVEDGS